MPTVTGQYMKDILALNAPSDITVTDMEKIVDTAIAALNLYGGLQLAQMGGTAGTKTFGCDIPTQGAVLIASRAIYYGFFERIKTASLSGLTLGVADLMSNPIVVKTIRDAATQLVQKDWYRAII